MSVSIYAARKMTGISWQQLTFDAAVETASFRNHGIDVLDPVELEVCELKEKLGHIPDTPVGNPNYGADLHALWYRDKKMIREADVFVDMTAGQRSEGVAHEMGYARYFLWMPVVRLYPEDAMLDQKTIAHLEDDAIAFSIEEAAELIHKRWGSRTKRLWWRLKMFARCWPKAVYRRLKKWS